MKFLGERKWKAISTLFPNILKTRDSDSLRNRWRLINERNKNNFKVHYSLAEEVKIIYPIIGVQLLSTTWPTFKSYFYVGFLLSQ